MDRLFVPAVAIFTSLLTWALATHRGRSSATLPRALVTSLETAGIALGFLTLNLTVGAIAVVGVRTLAHGFVSFYVMDDGLLALAALGQAVVFQAWRSEKRSNSAP